MCYAGKNGHSIFSGSEGNGSTGEGNGSTGQQFGTGCEALVDNHWHKIIWGK